MANTAVTMDTQFDSAGVAAGDDDEDAMMAPPLLISSRDEEEDGRRGARGSGLAPVVVSVMMWDIRPAVLPSIHPTPLHTLSPLHTTRPLLLVASFFCLLQIGRAHV